MSKEIRQMIDIIKNINKNKVITESIDDKYNNPPQITITKDVPDERSNNSNEYYNVNYQVTVNGMLIEIEGIISQIQGNFQFEPTSFTNNGSEEYYDNNWENIEDEILTKFNNEF